SSSHPGQAPVCNEEKRKKETRLSDVHQHPPCPRARRQTTDRVEIIKRNNSLYSSRTRQLPPSLRTEREDQEYSLLGAEDIQSSTRVDSMALLGTKARDKHYRNDSPVEK
ncbi:hypothetical protein BBK36DRAFT_1174503, partial [Trichoderma citrinoviride]